MSQSSTPIYTLKSGAHRSLRVRAGVRCARAVQDDNRHFAVLHEPVAGPRPVRPLRRRMAGRGALQAQDATHARFSRADIEENGMGRCFGSGHQIVLVGGGAARERKTRAGRKACRVDGGAAGAPPGQARQIAAFASVSPAAVTPANAACRGADRAPRPVVQAVAEGHGPACCHGQGQHDLHGRPRQRGAGIRATGALTPTPPRVRRHGRSLGVRGPACG